MMDGYGIFAGFYDELTRNASYIERAEYILEVFNMHGHIPRLTLDLACGTGTLTTYFKQVGVDIYGVDASEEMLAEAMRKNAERGLDILYLCQPMQELDLYGTINTCICTLDSINHLTDSADVQRTFDRVSLFMEPGGCFLFDVNTVYKHRYVLADNTFVYDTDEVFCVWQNSLRENNIVDIELTFFEPDGDAYYRTDECFSERAYTDGELTAMLEKAGFGVEARYGDLSFSKPGACEQRVVYLARKVR